VLLFERAYGDLRIADGTRRRRPAALGALVRIGDGGRFRRRRRAEPRRRPPVEGGLATSCGRCGRVPARGRRRKGSSVRGGMRGDGHEVSILIRLGDGERQGRGPWNVSTMSIRPPQHGQRRAGETSSA
jgi:hypothetical protein